jgi:hypothetical protein
MDDGLDQVNFQYHDLKFIFFNSESKDDFFTWKRFRVRRVNIQWVDVDELMFDSPPSDLGFRIASQAMTDVPLICYGLYDKKYEITLNRLGFTKIGLYGMNVDVVISDYNELTDFVHRNINFTSREPTNIVDVGQLSHKASSVGLMARDVVYGYLVQRRLDGQTILLGSESETLTSVRRVLSPKKYSSINSFELIGLPDVSRTFESDRVKNLDLIRRVDFFEYTGIDYSEEPYIFKTPETLDVSDLPRKALIIAPPGSGKSHSQFVDGDTLVDFPDIDNWWRVMDEDDQTQMGIEHLNLLSDYNGRVAFAPNLLALKRLKNGFYWYSPPIDILKSNLRKRSGNGQADLSDFSMDMVEYLDNNFPHTRIRYASIDFRGVRNVAVAMFSISNTINDHYDHIRYMRSFQHGMYMYPSRQLGYYWRDGYEGISFEFSDELPNTLRRHNLVYTCKSLGDTSEFHGLVIDLDIILGDFDLSTLYRWQFAGHGHIGVTKKDLDDIVLLTRDELILIVTEISEANLYMTTNINTPGGIRVFKDTCMDFREFHKYPDLRFCSLREFISLLGMNQPNLETDFFTYNYYIRRNHPILDLWHVIYKGNIWDFYPNYQHVAVSNTLRVRQLSPLIARTYKLHDEALHYTRRRAFMEVFPDGVALEGVDVNGLVVINGETEYLSISGHMVNVLIDTILRGTDIVRYMDTIEFNVSNVGRPLPRDYVRLLRMGMMLEAETSMEVGVLWHSYYEYIIAIEAAKLLMLYIGYPYLDSIFEYVKFRLDASFPKRKRWLRSDAVNLFVKKIAR